MISFDQAQEIARRSAGGEGVVSIITSMGLKRKETLIELRDKYSDLISEAKRQQKSRPEKKQEDPLPEVDIASEVMPVELAKVVEPEAVTS